MVRDCGVVVALIWSPMRVGCFHAHNLIICPPPPINKYESEQDSSIIWVREAANIKEYYVNTVFIVIFYRTCVALRCGSFRDLPSKYAEEASRSMTIAAIFPERPAQNCMLNPSCVAYTSVQRIHKLYQITLCFFIHSPHIFNISLTNVELHKIGRKLERIKQTK